MDVGALLKSLGGPTGAAVVPIILMYTAFLTIDDFDRHVGMYMRHVAESNRGYILDVVEKAANEPSGEFKDSLCRTLRESVSELCANAPDDALCTDRAMLFERAGC